MNQNRSVAATIRSYVASDRDSFVTLNLEWIEEYFAVEDSDREQLEKLEHRILAPGGQIIVAELAEGIVGTGAIVPALHAPDGRKWFEIIKMATAKEHRGKGIGRAVLDRLISNSRSMQVDAIWLETNSAMQAATHLYESSGFRHLSSDEWWPTPYERCNMQMVLEL